MAAYRQMPNGAEDSPVRRRFTDLDAQAPGSTHDALVRDTARGSQPGDLSMGIIETTASPIATGVETKDMMMALVYGGPGQRAWQAKPRPLVRDPGDAVVRITTSTICGTGGNRRSRSNRTFRAVDRPVLFTRRDSDDRP